MTFREIAIYADGVNERDAQKWREQLTLVHLGANLSRVPLPAKGKPDTFPTLESLMPKPALTRKQMAAELRGRLALLQRRNNKRFTKKPKKKKNG